MQFISNFLKVSPLLIITAAFSSAFINNNKVSTKFLIYVLLIGILNYLLKMFTHKITGDVHPWIRPNPPSEGCGLFNNCKHLETTEFSFGFPSGHAQTLSFTAMFWTLYLIKNEKNLYLQYTKIALLWLFCFIVCYSRISLGCHNLLQIMGGFIIGSSLGFLLFYL